DQGEWLIPAAACRHLGQRQSCPDAGSGMSRRKGCAWHQQSPSRSHAKAVPQRAQLNRREVRDSRGCNRPPCPVALFVGLATKEAGDLPAASLLDVAQLLATDR